MVEGTPLLRVHPGKTWIQGSNPCVSANPATSKRPSGRFVFVPNKEFIKDKMFEVVVDFSLQAWIAANRLAGYALINLLDDPAILAMAFC